MNDDDELSDEMEHSEEEEDIVDTDEEEEDDDEKIYERLPAVTTGVGSRLGGAFTAPLPPISIITPTVTGPKTTLLTPLPPITVLSPVLSPVTTLTTLTQPPITQFIQPAGEPQLATNQLVTPTVICLKGKKGTWGQSLENSPPDVLYIGKSFNMGGWKLEASKWNNPYQAKKYGRDEALTSYRKYILNAPHLLNSLPELSGKTLACWCAPDPCHGDVLVQLFNERLLGKITAPVPVLPTATQIVAPAIPAVQTSNIPLGVGVGGLPPLPAVTPIKPVITPTTAPLVPVGVPKLELSPTSATGLVPPLPPVTTTTSPALPPPIPAELIRPMPVLAVQKPSPTLTIQPISPSSVTTVMTGGVLPPPPQTKIVVTQPVAVQPVVKPTVTLDSLLVKNDTESNDLFNMRSSYSRVAMKVFNNQINPATAVLIGRMAANKAIFGVTYPDESDRVLRYVNVQIAANPTLFNIEMK